MARFCRCCGRSLDDHPRKPAFELEYAGMKLPFGPDIPVCDVELIAGPIENPIYLAQLDNVERPWERRGKDGARYVHRSLLPGGQRA